MTRIDKVNRLALALFGLALALAGGYGLCRSYGGFGDERARDPFLSERIRAFVGRNNDWFWPVAFVVALALAYAGYRILRAELRAGPRVHPIRETQGADEVVLAPSVVADAVADDLETDPMITAVRARISRTDKIPEIDLDLTVPDDVPLSDLRRRVGEQALGRARAALESPPLRSRVVVSLAGPAGRHLD